MLFFTALGISSCGGGYRGASVADFALSTRSAPLTLTAGTGTAVFELAISPLNNFTEPVQVSLSGAPAGVNVFPVSFTAVPGARQFISVLATPDAVEADSVLSIRATSGTRLHSLTLPLHITTPATAVVPVADITPRTAGRMGAALSSTLTFPSGFMKSVKDYGATGNGVTDDTSAIQAALADGRSNTTGNYYGVPKALYFPAGTYLVRNTLNWNGCCVTLQGAGPSASVIRLAPGSSGFSSAATPKALISTPGGITSFRQNIWDIGISIGAANPGAVALDYVSNNNGSVHNVSIVSEDLQAKTGIALTRHYPGPLMLRDVSIHGFQYGIDTAAYEYGPTIERLTLDSQTVAGIHNKQQTISIRGLQSTNTVPALINEGGFALIIDATLSGGSSTAGAITSNSSLYLRNVSSTGYRYTLQDTHTTNPQNLTGTVTEYMYGTPLSLASVAKPASLNLPVVDTPSYQSGILSAWAPFVPTYYGDTKPLPTLLQSGASTIYFPFGHYLSYNETALTVPDSVNRIVGFSSVVNGNTAGTNGGGIKLVVNSNITQPLIIEQFGYGIKVEHHGKRPVVIKNGRYTYTSFAGAGNVFFEDVELSAVQFQAGQSIWARQLDSENATTKITNYGNLWLFGLKTEQSGIVIDTGAGGQTELLGNLIYPAQTMSANSIALQSTDANVSYMYSESSYCSTCGYGVQVAETRNGTTRHLTASQSGRYVMHLFVGY